MQSPDVNEATEDLAPLSIKDNAHLFDFTEPNAFADVILVVEKNELYTSRYLLASVSSVFSAMLSSDTQTIPHRIPLPDDAVEDIKTMLAWMMPATRTSLSDCDFERLVHVAFKYDIQLLLQESEKQLVGNFEGGTEDDNTRLAYLVIAQNYKLAALRECSVQYFSRLKFSVLKSLPNFNQLQRDTLFDIHERRVIHLENSNEEVERSDAINLIVEGKAIPASRSILSAASPVFGAMLSSSFREATAKDIPLPGKSCEDVKYMVDFISLPDYLPLTDSLLDGMVQMADEYQIEKLKKHCELFMVDALATSGTSADNKMLHYFLLSQKYNISAVIDATKDLLAKTDIKILTSFSSYKEADMYAIFCSRISLLEVSLEKYSKISMSTIDGIEGVFSEIRRMAYGGTLPTYCQHSGIADRHSAFRHYCSGCVEILKKYISDKNNTYFNQSLPSTPTLSVKLSYLSEGRTMLSNCGLEHSKSQAISNWP